MTGNPHTRRATRQRHLSAVHELAHTRTPCAAFRGRPGSAPRRAIGSEGSRQCCHRSGSVVTPATARERTGRLRTRTGDGPQPDGLRDAPGRPHSARPRGRGRPAAVRTPATPGARDLRGDGPPGPSRQDVGDVAVTGHLRGHVHPAADGRDANLQMQVLSGLLIGAPTALGHACEWRCPPVTPWRRAGMTWGCGRMVPFTDPRPLVIRHQGGRPACHRPERSASSVPTQWHPAVVAVVDLYGSLGGRCPAQVGTPSRFMVRHDGFHRCHRHGGDGLVITDIRRDVTGE